MGLETYEILYSGWHLTSYATAINLFCREYTVVTAIDNNGNQSQHDFQFICMNK